MLPFDIGNASSSSSNNNNYDDPSNQPQQRLQQQQHSQQPQQQQHSQGHQHHPQQQQQSIEDPYSFLINQPIPPPLPFLDDDSFMSQWPLLMDFPQQDENPMGW